MALRIAAVRAHMRTGRANSVPITKFYRPDEQHPAGPLRTHHCARTAAQSDVPTLLLYGRNDFGYPVSTFQALLFPKLGAEYKDYRALEGGPTRRDNRM